jgi:hypothetical protein
MQEARAGSRVTVPRGLQVLSGPPRAALKPERRRLEAPQHRVGRAAVTPAPMLGLAPLAAAAGPSAGRLRSSAVPEVGASAVYPGQRVRRGAGAGTRVPGSTRSAPSRTPPPWAPPPARPCPARILPRARALPGQDSPSRLTQPRRACVWPGRGRGWGRPGSLPHPPFRWGSEALGGGD